MKATFSQSDLDAVAQQMEAIQSALSLDPEYIRNSHKKTSKMINSRISELLKEPPANRWFGLSILHLLLLVYSGFVIPFEIGFGVEVEGALLILDIFCTV